MFRLTTRKASKHRITGLFGKSTCKQQVTKGQPVLWKALPAHDDIMPLGCAFRFITIAIGVTVDYFPWSTQHVGSTDQGPSAWAASGFVVTWLGYFRFSGLQRPFREHLGRLVTTLMLEQNGQNFADDIFKCNFMNGNYHTWIGISYKFVLLGAIHNKSPLVQVNGLALNRWQAITWTNGDPVPWRIYASPGRKWLKHCSLWYQNSTDIFFLIEFVQRQIII